jgi:large subunit ribosomal protein L10
VPTARKAAVIEDLTEKLTRANAAALIDYRGLTVAEISELRRQLRQREVELEVTKNTLLREAAHRNDMMELDELFVGPTAVAFIYGDEPTGTKTLNEFFRTARVGEIKSGILKGGRRLTAQEFARLAELPSRQTLLAQIAGLLESPMAQLAALFNAPAQQLAYALNALIEKGGAGGEGGAGGPGARGEGSEAAAEAEPPTPDTA